ncbi:SRPBCC family protein [Nocardia stercoris]|uniref:SRPBCC family protein n=1 Tax=Nocardia stercoris TaxID=2483361 RepID=A0A3M2L542_9NOCA|nr:hypothetical protein [Nocardia stercoris]RMI32701.1 hypothetical protein EBN03_12115 [Nocardia stercoris]
MTFERVVRTSLVDAPVAAVWAAVTTPAGFNAELWPYLRMTVPRPFRGATIADVTPGMHIGRSVLLLFGVLPIDYDDITIAEIDEGRRFREESAMLSMRPWIHERALRPVGDRTEVTDTLTFAPRPPLALVPGAGAVLRGIVAALFRHRHRRLGSLLGA